MRISEEHIANSLRPYVLVHAETGPGAPLIYLKIRNTGNSAARKLRLTINKPFRSFDSEDSDISKSRVFNELIETFPPGAEFAFLLCSAFENLSRESQTKPASFQISAAYSNGSEHFRETTTIDLLQFAGTSIISDSTRQLELIGKHLEKVEKTLDRSFRQLGAKQK